MATDRGMNSELLGTFNLDKLFFSILEGTFCPREIFMVFRANVILQMGCVHAKSMGNKGATIGLA